MEGCCGTGVNANACMMAMDASRFCSRLTIVGSDSLGVVLRGRWRLTFLQSFPVPHPWLWRFSNTSLQQWQWSRSSIRPCKRKGTTSFSVFAAINEHANASDNDVVLQEAAAAVTAAITDDDEDDDNDVHDDDNGDNNGVEPFQSSPLENFHLCHHAFFEGGNLTYLKRLLDAGSLSSAPCILVMLGSEAFVDGVYQRCPDASVVVAHFSIDILASIKEKYDDARCWYITGTDFADIDISGLYDTIFLNHFSVFSSSLEKVLHDVAQHCKLGGTVVISLPQDKKSLLSIKGQSHGLLQSFLPDSEELAKIMSSLPFRMVFFNEMTGCYLAAFKKEFPLHMSGKVTHGLGRGSKQLGFPTANLSLEDLPLAVTQLAHGVYYGWAQVVGLGPDSNVYRMVMNIGYRPTFDKDDIVSLEVHILHNYKLDFYNKEIRIAILGFIREEMKFACIDDLVNQIKEDIKFVERRLVDKEYQARSNTFFSP